MEREALRALLEQVRGGRARPRGGAGAARGAPLRRDGDARVDTHRALRQGLPEVIFGAGKTPEQIAEIAGALRRAGQPLLVTRVEPEAAPAILARLPEADYDPAGAARSGSGRRRCRCSARGTIAVVSAGTADLPVANEAIGVARRFGNKVDAICRRRRRRHPPAARPPSSRCARRAC